MLSHKVCKGCNEPKPISEFHLRKSGKRIGKPSTSFCKGCTSTIKGKYYKDNIKRIKKYRKDNSEYMKMKRREYEARPEIRVYQWCRGTIRNHTVKGYDVKIQLGELHEYAKIAKYCPLCGCLINWEQSGHNGPDSPTLDRVNNGKVLDHIWYGPEDKSDGAVAIICYQCNATKQNRTYQDLVEYCIKIINRDKVIRSYDS